MSAPAGGEGAVGRRRLPDLAPGSVARVVEIDASVAEWRERLQAYGLAPGRRLEVVQQAPVTVVRVDHTDLAFEARIARGIVVAEPDAGTPSGDAAASDTGPAGA